MTPAKWGKAPSPCLQKDLQISIMNSEYHLFSLQTPWLLAFQLVQTHFDFPWKSWKLPRKSPLKCDQFRLVKLLCRLLGFIGLRPAKFWRIPNGELVPLLMWPPGAAGKNEHPSCLPKGGLVREKVEKHCHVCQFYFLPKKCDCKFSRWVIGISWYLYDILLIYFWWCSP